jgi:hypothetical protein
MDENGFVRNSRGIEHCVMNYFGNGSDMGCLELKQFDDRVEELRASAQPATPVMDSAAAANQAYINSLIDKISEENKEKEKPYDMGVYRPFGFFP